MSCYHRQMPSESVSATIAAALKRAPNVLRHLGLDPKTPSKWRQVGAGETARVWRLPSGDVLKATIDSNDAWASQLIADAGHVDGLVRVKAVFTVPRDRPAGHDVYLVVEEYAPALDTLKMSERSVAAKAAQKLLSWYSSSGATPFSILGIEEAVQYTTGSTRYRGALDIARNDFEQLRRGWQWLKERNFHVSDIHDGNVGLTADGRVVLFDLGANRNAFKGAEGTEPKVAVASNKLTPNRTLYHGTTRTAAEQIRKSGGLEPRAGAFVAEMYDELADAEGELPELVFATDKDNLDRALTAMRQQVGLMLGGDLHDVTEEDLRNHGALLIIRDGDSGMRRRDDDDDGREEHPGTVEPGDYYSDDTVDVDAILTGPTMMRVLRRAGLLPFERFGDIEPQRRELRRLAHKHHRGHPREDIETRVASLPTKDVRAMLGTYQKRERPMERNARDLPRTSAIFDSLFDQLATDFDDFGEIELHCDEEAGSDNGHGSDRQFGYCSTEAPWRIAFAAKIETLPDEYISGLVRHELGHALDYRYGRKAMERRFGKKLPDSVERRADKIAEYVFGAPIEYGDLDIQCVACEGKPARPRRLG